MVIQYQITNNRKGLSSHTETINTPLFSKEFTKWGNFACNVVQIILIDLKTTGVFAEGSQNSESD